MEFCCYCGCELVWPTNEHIIPKSKGGSDHPKNKRPCCSRCNKFRGNKSFQYWKAEILELISLGRDWRTFRLWELEVILENIEYIEQAVATATPEMFK